MKTLVKFIALMLFSATLFAATTDGQWRLGIGDPTFFGWLTVIAYIITAYLSFKQYRRLAVRFRASKFWLFLALGLVLLSINKQLDLQTLFTQILRDHAFANGWYEQRRALQSAFIVFLVVAMLMALAVSRLFLAQSWRSFKYAWVGIVLLCTFVIIRAASFHNFDTLIGTEFLGLRTNVILEMGALIIIMIAAMKRYDVSSASAKDYLEIESTEDAVQCPKCAHPAISGAVHGRLFKCKSCKHHYTLFIASSRQGLS